MPATSPRHLLPALLFLFAALSVATCRAETVRVPPELARDLVERIDELDRKAAGQRRHAGEGAAHRLIAELTGKINALARAGKRAGPIRDAEARAGEAMRALVADADAEVLVARDRHGRTPLMRATSFGYPSLVAALLESGAVRGSIDARDGQDNTAWVLANLAFRQVMLVCSPSLVDSPGAVSGVMSLMPYYMWVRESPYRVVRGQLEAAGATPDIERARQAWQTTCRGQEAATRELVATSDDLLDTLLDQSRTMLARGLANAMRSYRRETESGREADR